VLCDVLLSLAGGGAEGISGKGAVDSSFFWLFPTRVGISSGARFLLSRATLRRRSANHFAFQTSLLPFNMNTLSISSRRKPGFTLIELLVVI